LLTGIGHYLAGDGIFNQAYEMLRYWVPQYISLGTMGLGSQEEDPETGLPLYLGVGKGYSEEEQCQSYMEQVPGYTADGYDGGKNNNGRIYLGLGPRFSNRANLNDAVDCELVSDTYPRAKISYREVISETYSEKAHTIDVALSALISTGALSEFRTGDNKYVFITEAGLWSVQDYVDGGDNGLLAGYRIIPPNAENYDMSVAENRQILKENIIRVGFNQVVQVVWKIQVGAIEDLETLS
jgi:hypothetical protein